jgi:8-oxo-dGTP pyrophosphatase MutT (NUDIX family)
MLQANSIRPLLQAFSTNFDEEKLFVQMAMQLCDRQPAQCCSRSNVEGHFTASAWVLNSTRDTALLIHHRGLDRWFQPGGHFEAQDIDLEAAVRRELQEECGIDEAILFKEGLFDLDIHPIPAKGDIAAHWHYDLRMCLVVPPDTQLQVQVAEIKALQWVPLVQLSTGVAVQQSLRRMALKSV